MAELIAVSNQRWSTIFSRAARTVMPARGTMPGLEDLLRWSVIEE
jgi:hypothetical protein